MNIDENIRKIKSAILYIFYETTIRNSHVYLTFFIG